jgi:hypothetical protein
MRNGLFGQIKAVLYVKKEEKFCGKEKKVFLCALKIINY